MPTTPAVSPTPTTTAASQAQRDVINPKLVVPFMNSVREVFAKMAKVDVKVSPPHFKTKPGSTYEVCGIIGFSGGITGSVVVSFSDAAAEKLVEAFAGMPLTRSSPDFADAVGELANMIAGGAKPHLGALASISTPNVIIGSGYTVASPTSTPCLVIPCSSPFGDFCLEVSINPRN
jgi:chemotaxis protein CheX